ncbi:MAG: hypothetical protein WC731_00295 [Candidatus Omnitrophota bacterium]|jgi:hypothetical protein
MRRKDLIELGLTGVLLLVLIFAFVNAAGKKRLRRDAPKAVDLTGAAAVDITDSGSLYNVLEKETESIELKRDPFTSAPIISQKNMQSGFCLTGILWDKLKPLAIIDAEVVKEGDRVGNKVVTDIKRDRVILSDGQEFFEIKLEP